MYTNSRLLQAVISGRGNGKFYRLPPDKENPALVFIILFIPILEYKLSLIKIINKSWGFIVYDRI
jgi:hypothetical protein